MYDSVISLLKDKSTPASTLFAVCYLEYGPEFLDWDPQLLRLELLEDFGVELSDGQSDKLQAAVIIVSTDQFENDWHSFNNCIHALNGEPFEHDVFYPIDAEQIASAMPEVEMLRNNFLGEGFVFSDEVNCYVGFVLSEYGLFNAPPEFSTALMPPLPGAHESSSQAEKYQALSSIYSAKKEKLTKYMDCLRHTILV